jgi:hypothetical protein
MLTAGVIVTPPTARMLPVDALAPPLISKEPKAVSGLEPEGPVMLTVPEPALISSPGEPETVDSKKMFPLVDSINTVPLPPRVKAFEN